MAQQPQSTDDALYDRALAAGYKAQFLCSGLWNGNKSVAQIEADELTGIYERIADIVPTLNANIDRDAHRVSVAFDENAPPRITVWNNRTGCTSLPIGSGGFETLPYSPRITYDDRAWPDGDRDANIVRVDMVLPIDTVAGAAFQPDDNPFGKALYGGNTSAVVIVQGGKIIWEDYKPGFDMHTGQRTWSVAKSIAGTLAGYAVHNHGTDINTSASVPEWQSPADPRNAITLDNLLRMASGLYSDTAGNRTDPVYMGGSVVAQRVTGWPMLHTPGTRFRYSNNDIMLAAYALRSADDRFDPNTLFGKLGMTRTYAETDWQGNYILSSQVWTTARDLARLGQLYLNDGWWTGSDGRQERLLPAGWRTYVSAPSGPQPDGAFGYGATFWLMNRSAGIPADTFAAFGNRGQYLVIIPSRDLVIVRRGYDTPENRFDVELFTRSIVASLD